MFFNFVSHLIYTSAWKSGKDLRNISYVMETIRMYLGLLFCICNASVHKNDFCPYSYNVSYYVPFLVYDTNSVQIEDDLRNFSV